MKTEDIIASLSKLSASEVTRVIDYGQALLGISKAPTKKTSTEKNSQQRVLGLHPGAMQMTPDFDEPLPESFWLGKESE